MGITKEYGCGICGRTYATLEERNKCETECLNEQKKQKAKAEKIAKAIPTNSDREIKIEWAKDYFEPDTVMAKQNDNVAQLCHYFRKLKKVIADAKKFGIGDTRLPDDAYVLLYENEIVDELLGHNPIKIYCMEEAAYVMSLSKYLNAFQYTSCSSGGYWQVEKSWPRNFGYYCKPACDYQVFCDLPLTFPDFEQYKEALYRYNSYKNTNGISLSDFYSGSKFLSETPQYEFVPKFVLNAEAQFFREKSYNALDEQRKWEKKENISNSGDISGFLLNALAVFSLIISGIAVVAKLILRDFEDIGWLIFTFILIFLGLKIDVNSSADNRIDEIIFKSNNKSVDNRDWKDKL